MKVVIYKIVNRELKFPRWVELPEDCRDFDSWLKANGYDGSYTIRRGLVSEPSPAEIRSIHRAAERLKLEGKLPSALGRIMGKLSSQTQK